MKRTNRLAAGLAALALAAVLAASPPPAAAYSKSPANQAPPAGWASAISMGNLHSAAIDQDGSLWLWG